MGRARYGRWRRRRRLLVAALRQPHRVVGHGSPASIRHSRAERGGRHGHWPCQHCMQATPTHPSTHTLALQGTWFCRGSAARLTRVALRVFGYSLYMAPSRAAAETQRQTDRQTDRLHCAGAGESRSMSNWAMDKKTAIQNKRKTPFAQQAIMRGIAPIRHRNRSSSFRAKECFPGVRHDRASANKDKTSHPIAPYSPCEDRSYRD